MPLVFLTGVDSTRARPGMAVRFRVAADVIVGRRVAIRAGAPASGIVTQVVPAGPFGRNARVRIAFVETTAMDGRPVRLASILVNAGWTRTATDRTAAAATSGLGVILLGPVGLAAGALIRGGAVVVPPGAIAITTTTEPIQLAGAGR